MTFWEPDNYPLKCCPFCESDRVPYADQPDSIFKILFKCGTDLTLSSDDDGFVIERSCVADDEAATEWREYNGY